MKNNKEFKSELEQLRYEKHLLHMKISNRLKTGKPVESLAQQMESLSMQISDLAKSTSKTTKKLDTVRVSKKKSSSADTAWPDLTYKQAFKNLSEWLDENDYEDGYQFRHSNNFFMHKPKISQDRKTKMLRFEFRLQFITKSRKVTKDIEWEVPYGQWSRIGTRLENLEKVILKETSDPDRSDQVFGYDRFQRALFFEKGYDKNGWKIRK